MKFVRTLAMGLALFLVSGCGDSTGLTVQDLTGTWNAANYVFTNPADTAQSVDIIAAQGASFAMTVASDSTVSTVFDNGQGGNSSDSGTFDATGTTLTLGGRAFNATRSGIQLVLVHDTDAYDFDSDGSDDPAVLTVLLLRQ